MNETSDTKPEESSGLSARGAVLTGVGIVVILVLALFLGLLVIPVLKAHRALAGLDGRRLLRLRAVQELGGPKQTVRRLRTYLRLPERTAPHKVRAVRLLGECGVPAIPILIELLVGSARDLAFLASDQLAKMGGVAIQDLLEAERKGEREVRYQVALTLAKMGQEAGPAVTLLRRMLQDEDPVVKLLAMAALMEIGEDVDVPRPVSLTSMRQIVGLGHAAPEMRMRCAIALGDHRTGCAVPALRRALEDPDQAVRRVTVIALGEIGLDATEAIPALERLLKDEDEWVREVAAEALKKIRNAE